MKKIEIVKYEPSHIEEIMKDPRPQELYLSKYEDWGKWAHQWYEMGPAHTLFIDGEIIMCAGMMIPRKGLGEAWMVLSNSFYKYKKECFRAVRDNLEQIIDKWKLLRVQAFVMINFPEAEHWLRHLGFVCETPNGMKKFGPMGEDMLLYGRKC